MSPAALLRALSSAAEHAPEALRMGHLAAPAAELAEQLGAGRVWLGIHAPTKAAILTELQRTGLADDDAERVYMHLLVIDRVLDRLGLAVVPAGPAREARIGGESEEEAELEAHSHLVEG